MSQLQNILNYELITESRGNQFRRPALSYSLNSLDPVIGQETMNEHYNVHYKKYTENLNSAIKEESVPVSSTEVNGIIDILKNVSKYSDKLRNNAGGYYNHLLYFNSIGKPNSTSPSEKTTKLINENFSSLSQMEKSLIESGLGQFGSGWVWLTKTGNKLEIVSTPNQDNPWMKRSFRGEVILGIDVWEHAYYLNYMADRKKYLKNFMDIINWDVVEKRLFSSK